jgi:hypothetical protein
MSSSSKPVVKVQSCSKYLPLSAYRNSAVPVLLYPSSLRGRFLWRRLGLRRHLRVGDLCLHRTHGFHFPLFGSLLHCLEVLLRKTRAKEDSGADLMEEPSINTAGSDLRGK